MSSSSELEQFGLIAKRPGGHYDDDALAIGQVVAEMARFGLEGRHLRAFRTFADREIGIFGQVVGPMSRQRNPGGQSPRRGDRPRAGVVVGPPARRARLDRIARSHQLIATQLVVRRSPLASV